MAEAELFAILLSQRMTEQGTNGDTIGGSRQTARSWDVLVLVANRRKLGPCLCLPILKRLIRQFEETSIQWYYNDSALLFLHSK